MDGRRKRGTAKHAGVVVISKPGADGLRWIARFHDPDKGGKKEEALPADRARTEEQRTAWAVEKAKELAKRAQVLETGGARKTDRALSDVIKEYYTLNAGRLRGTTEKAYRLGTEDLLAFASERGLKKADELRGPHLEAFRAWSFSRPRMALLTGKGKGRGKRATSPEERRSTVSVNSRLRACKTVLDAVRRLGLVPMLSHDNIRDSLRAETEPRPLPEYLRAGQIRALVRAALRHDAEQFKMTREERARGVKGKRGETAKREPIAPFLVVCLLTGMRFDEARTLPWSAIELDADPAGCIHVSEQTTKTKHARIVDLEVSPALRFVLRAMKLRAGKDPYVFSGDELAPAERGRFEAARKRLKGFGAPTFSWQLLRSTCGTFLANASGIFGGASAYREARQLGHSVQVAERHYLGTVSVPREAKDLETAMGIADLMPFVVRVAGGEKGVEPPKEKAAKRA